MKFRFTFFIALMLFTVASPKQNLRAMEASFIVASVGDNAITNQDLIHKMKIIIISSGLQSSPEVIEKIKPQALQNLINEQLQIAEADKLGIETSQTELDKAVATLEKQNGLPPAGLKDLLEKNQVPFEAMLSQIRAEISWAKIRKNTIIPLVDVSEEEALDFVRANDLGSKKIEYLMHEIVLPVEDPKNEEKILTLGQELRTKIASGNDFKKLAKQFSGSASSAAGGEVGWLTENQIPKEIYKVLKDLPVGEVAGPIRSIEGYFLVKVTDTRIISSAALNDNVSLKQFSLPITGKDPEDEFKKLSEVKEPILVCRKPSEFAKKNNLKLKDFGEIQIKTLPKNTANLVSSLRVGKLSSPVIDSGMLKQFIVCSRSENITQQDINKQIFKAKDFLFRRKVELESRKRLRKMRLSTNIEIREN